MAKQTRHPMHKPRRQNPARVFTRAALTSLAGLMLWATVIAEQSTTQEQTQENPSQQLQFAPSDINLPLPDGVDLQRGFRMERYRAPVPQINPGTEVVNTARAYQLYRSGKVKFIDVYPPRGLGADPLDGSWVMSESHENIEGSTWLPEVGRGFLEDGHIDYFERNLQIISGGNKNTFLLFYCSADCWQSWNAARRALLWGYNNIFWYPEGTDGWKEENHTVVPAQPVNFLGE